jgi:hypothetical protein
MGARTRPVLLHAGAYAALLAALALLSWLGQGWGYFVLYGVVVATFGLLVGAVTFALARSSRWRSHSPPGDFAVRSLRSFSRAQATLFTALVAAAVLARLTSGPLGPFPGGPFQGVPFEGPFEAELLRDDEEVQLQVPAPSPYTITTHAFVIDGSLYVGADFVFPFKRWVHIVQRNPQVSLRIGGRLFERRAVRIQEPGEARRLLEQVSRERGVDPDDWLTDVWFFRMDPPE